MTADSTPILEWLDGSAAAEALNPIMEARGWTLLNGSDSPVLTRARVARDDDGEIVGAFVLQMFPMLGPVFTVHGTDKRLFRDMMCDMRSFLHESKARGWMIVAENPRIAELCEGLGFVKETNPVYWCR